MSENTQPLFVVGSGRSGTQALERLFASSHGVEMHHEYMIHHIQPLGVQYFHGLVSKDYVLDVIKSIHGAAIKYSTASIWGDTSNKLSWMITELSELFPSAKFVHVVRDGRKVTSSLFNKLGDECLDDVSVEIFMNYLISASHMPPPEKKYWWPIAFSGGRVEEHYLRLSHYGRIAYHWNQINEHIEKQLQGIEENNVLRVRLEDITSDKNSLFSLMKFAGVQPTEQHFELMKKPHNVIRPENNPLTNEQLEVFWKYCAKSMDLYGYSDNEEYDLNYHSDQMPKVQY